MSALQPYLATDRAVLYRADCIEYMRTLPDACIDSIVCDPPYGLGFMGRAWDALPPGADWAAECLRVLKPGGHVVAFGGTRTVHRLTVALEDSGFEIRDTLQWCYFSGFPKSLDVSKALDAAAGAERAIVGRRVRLGDTTDYPTRGGSIFAGAETGTLTAPATPAAIQWSGWGTAVKPAIEPAVLARKPLTGTVADNVTAWGVGALNIDACRFGYGDRAWVGPGTLDQALAKNPGRDDMVTSSVYGADRPQQRVNVAGRFPANLYYCPKASRKERERGCDGLPAVTSLQTVDRAADTAGVQNPRSGAGRGAGVPRYKCAVCGLHLGGGRNSTPCRDTLAHTPVDVGSGPGVSNYHPTVKPVEIMRWLMRLVTPPGGVTFDPFMGSGSAGVAAALEGFTYIGCELYPFVGRPVDVKSNPDYISIAAARILHAAIWPDEWADTAPGYARVIDR